MKKIFSFILFAFFCTTLTAHAVKTYKISADVQAGIKNYRGKNYAGAIADLNRAIQKDPKDSFAYYYLGNVYAAIGKSIEANQNYSRVIELKEIPGLILYAMSAKQCLVDETKCGEIKELGQTAEITEFVRSGQFIDTTAKDRMRDEELKNAKEMINQNNKDGVDFSKFRYINDASGEIPTDKEIADAVKVLAKVGFNPLAQTNYLAQGVQNDSLYSLSGLMSGNVSPELLQNYLTGSMFAGFSDNDMTRGF